MSFSTPSIGSATSTRLDSGSKHIQQCRVSQDHMVQLAMQDENELMRNKFRYCVHKDELVLAIGKPWGINEKKFQNNAYPRVLSNLGKIGDLVDGRPRPGARLLKWMYHNARSIQERNDLLEAFRAAARDKRGVNWGAAPFAGASHSAGGEPYFPPPAGGGPPDFAEEIELLHDFVAMGYANTLGWAHEHHGDTMTSVMIGGLRTVRNGDFEVYTGDLLQWYWPFERDCFNKHGKRRPVCLRNVDPGGAPDAAGGGDGLRHSMDTVLRKRYYEREFGQREDTQKCVAQIKPFKRDDENPRLYDWYRVFAVAISSARPYDAVDIRISCQAI